MKQSRKRLTSKMNLAPNLPPEGKTTSQCHPTNRPPRLWRSEYDLGNENEELVNDPATGKVMEKVSSFKSRSKKK